MLNVVTLCCRICYTDSIGVQEDQYPPNIAVKVNQSYCHVPVSWLSFMRHSTASEKKYDLNKTPFKSLLGPMTGKSYKWYLRTPEGILMQQSI